MCVCACVCVLPPQGMTPLHVAAQAGHEHVIFKLVMEHSEWVEKGVVAMGTGEVIGLSCVLFGNDEICTSTSKTPLHSGA